MVLKYAAIFLLVAQSAFAFLPPSALPASRYDTVVCVVVYVHQKL
jgi:hypothetical protein